MAEILFKKYCPHVNPETEMCKRSNKACEALDCKTFKDELRTVLPGEEWNIAVEIYARFKKPPMAGVPRRVQQKGVVSYDKQGRRENPVPRQHTGIAVNQRQEKGIAIRKD